MTQDNANQVGPISRVSLPPAAQRWLDRALPQDLDLPAVIRIEQEGTMDLRGRWTPFQASGVYRANPLSFDWRARFSLMPGAWIVAEDGHRDGHGWGGARLWGVIPMGRRTDPEVLATQVVRNLAELAWLPPFVLADPSLKWAGAGGTAFEVRSGAGDREVMVRFEIDERGDIIRAWSPARPYDVPGGYAEAPWYYEFSVHGQFGSVRIPAAAAATFEKREGLWPYFRARVTSATFGITPY
jgi:hypothetical protein